MKYNSRQRIFVRKQAADYLQMGVSKFDKLCEENGQLKPRLMGKRKVWLLETLDDYIDELPVADNENDDFVADFKIK